MCLRRWRMCLDCSSDSTGVPLLLILTPTCRRHMRGVVNHLPVCVELYHMWQSSILIIKQCREKRLRQITWNRQ